LKYIITFSEAIANPSIVGGKGANLIKLSHLDINIPSGFIVLTNAFITLLSKVKNFGQLLSSLEKETEQNDILNYSSKIKEIIINAQLPKDLNNELKETYEKLYQRLGGKPSFAVRPSVTIEDVRKFSFAGIAATYLYNNNLEDIFQSFKNCYASLFSPPAILYLLQMKKKGLNISLYDIQMAVIIQRMVDSDVSGVLYSANVSNNDRKQMLIKSSWGLGETITDNTVDPDSIVLNKDEFAIVKKIIGKKEIMSIKNPEGSFTIITDTDPNLRNKCSLDENQLRKLYDLGLKLEDEFNCPQEIEWAFDHDVLYTLLSRPITTLKPED
jgi:pyruvate,water dikinase